MSDPKDLVYFTTEIGTVWPNPLDPTETEWALRHGEPTMAQRLIAASFISAYRDILLWGPRNAPKRLAELRRIAKRLRTEKQP